jgi:4-amino-4-deoxy-L-arabinose transferase-like glycosyltransferase
MPEQQIRPVKTTIVKCLPYFGLLIITLLFRFPYFFDSAIDWDENTFILVSQGVTEGHLPYTGLWDNKPPLVFFFIAAIIFLFGKAILFIRISAALLIAGASWILYFMLKRRSSVFAAFFPALLLVSYCCFNPGSSVLFTEHMAMAPLCISLLMLFSNNTGKRAMFIHGCVLAIACLFRLNLVYYAIGVCLVLSYLLPAREKIHKGLLLIAGILTPFLIIILVYLFDGSLMQLYVGGIKAPLAFTGDQLSFDLGRNCSLLMKIIQKSLTKSMYLLWACFIAGLWYGFSLLKKRRGLRREILVVLFLFVCTVFSIIKTDKIFNHYLMMLIPFIAVLTFYLLNDIKKKRWKILFGVFFILGMGWNLFQLAHSYGDFYQQCKEKKTVYWGVDYQIADYLKGYDLKNRYVFFWGNHIGYWLTDTKMPTRIAHPSNLVRRSVIKALYPANTPMSEMISIFSKEPQFVIVSKKRLKYFSDEPKVLDYFQEELLVKYDIVKTFEDVTIYKRRQSFE